MPAGPMRFVLSCFGCTHSYKESCAGGEDKSQTDKPQTQAACQTRHPSPLLLDVGPSFDSDASKALAILIGAGGDNVSRAILPDSTSTSAVHPIKSRHNKENGDAQDKVLSCLQEAAEPAPAASAPHRARSDLVLASTYDALTLFSFTGRVLHQNAASRTYLGDHAPHATDTAAAGAAAAAVAAEGEEDGLNVLAAVFAHEPATLAAMLEYLQAGGEGTLWKGIVRVPRRLQPAAGPAQEVPSSASLVPAVPGGGSTDATAEGRDPRVTAGRTSPAIRLSALGLAAGYCDDRGTPYAGLPGAIGSTAGRSPYMDSNAPPGDGRRTQCASPLGMDACDQIFLSIDFEAAAAGSTAREAITALHRMDTFGIGGRSGTQLGASSAILSRQGSSVGGAAPLARRPQSAAPPERGRRSLMQDGAALPRRLASAAVTSAAAAAAAADTAAGALAVPSALSTSAFARALGAGVSIGGYDTAVLSTSPRVNSSILMSASADVHMLAPPPPSGACALSGTATAPVVPRSRSRISTRHGMFAIDECGPQDLSSGANARDRVSEDQHAPQLRARSHVQAHSPYRSGGGAGGDEIRAIPFNDDTCCGLSGVDGTGDSSFRPCDSPCVATNDKVSPSPATGVRRAPPRRVMSCMTLGSAPSSGAGSPRTPRPITPLGPLGTGAGGPGMSRALAFAASLRTAPMLPPEPAHVPRVTLSGAGSGSGAFVSQGSQSFTASAARSGSRAGRSLPQDIEQRCRTLEPFLVHPASTAGRHMRESAAMAAGARGGSEVGMTNDNGGSYRSVTVGGMSDSPASIHCSSTAPTVLRLMDSRRHSSDVRALASTPARASRRSMSSTARNLPSSSLRAGASMRAGALAARNRVDGGDVFEASRVLSGGSGGGAAEADISPFSSAAQLDVIMAAGRARTSSGNGSGDSSTSSRLGAGEHERRFSRVVPAAGLRASFSRQSPLASTTGAAPATDLRASSSATFPAAAMSHGMGSKAWGSSVPNPATDSAAAAQASEKSQAISAPAAALAAAALRHSHDSKPSHQGGRSPSTSCAQVTASLPAVGLLTQQLSARQSYGVDANTRSYTTTSPWSVSATQQSADPAARGIDEDGHDVVRDRSKAAEPVAAAVDEPECWHEVWARLVEDPVSGRDAVVLAQHDVSAKVVAERHLALVMETEHRLLEQLFPRHILQYITEEWTGGGGAALAQAAADPAADGGGDQAAAAADGGGGGGSGDGSAGAQPLWRPTVPRDCNALATTHPRVTLLFADIKGFTPLCEAVPPRAVMAMLNDLFSRFDAVLDKYGVYKVETIGDCYFVAGGLMAEDEDGMAAVRGSVGGDDPNHAHGVFGFAQAMLAAAAQVRLPTTGEPVSMRIGLHSGPVVSGVVGSRMPRFCLFGDTVNTASRMESTGTPGAIHASAATYELLSDEPGWEPTGGIQVKGKGLMRTYLWRPPPPAANGKANGNGHANGVAAGRVNDPNGCRAPPLDLARLLAARDSHASSGTHTGPYTSLYTGSPRAPTAVAAAGGGGGSSGGAAAANGDKASDTAAGGNRPGQSSGAATVGRGEGGAASRVGGGGLSGGGGGADLLPPPRPLGLLWARAGGEAPRAVAAASRGSPQGGPSPQPGPHSGPLMAVAGAGEGGGGGAGAGGGVVAGGGAGAGSQGSSRSSRRRRASHLAGA